MLPAIMTAAVLTGSGWVLVCTITYAAVLGRRDHPGD
jgi:hypothetical protein